MLALRLSVRNAVRGGDQTNFLRIIDKGRTEEMCQVLKLRSRSLFSLS